MRKRLLGTSIAPVGAAIALVATGLWAQSAREPAKPKLSPEAQQHLADARAAYTKARAKLQEEGTYSCCIQPGCMFCGMSAGMCPCGRNIAEGKPVCPECYGGQYAGHGKFEGIDLKEDLKFLPVSKLKMMYGMQAQAVPEGSAGRAAALEGAKAQLVSVTGRTGCAHCEFGVNPISDSQSMGIAVKADDGKVYVVEGGEAKYPDLYRGRFGGLQVALQGKVKRQQGRFVWIEPTRLQQVTDGKTDDR